MPTSLRASVGALFATVFAAASLILAGPAIATASPVDPAVPPLINFVPVGPLIDAESIQVGATFGTPCDTNVEAGQITITEDFAPAIGVNVTAGVSAYGFAMTVPATIANAPGEFNSLDVSVTCDVSASPVTMLGTFSWAQINVTKIVEGPAPAGALFPILVDCTPTVTDLGASSVDPAVASLTFPFTLAAGQTRSLLAMTDATCTISEADSVGASTSLVSPASVTISESTTYNVVVTNTFAETPKFTG